MVQSLSGCPQRITEAGAPVFPGLPPALEQGKHILDKSGFGYSPLCLEKGKWLSKTKKGAEPFCKHNGVTVLEAGQEMSSGLGLLLLVHNDR